MAPKRIVRRPTRDERKQARQAIGTLRSALVAPAARKRYYEAVELFLKFVETEGFRLPQSMAALDGLVCAHIERLWLEGDPKSYAADCLSGMKHYIPATGGNLRGAWRLFTAWTHRELPHRAPPLTMLFTYALADEFKRQRWVDTCVLALLGFHTFARTGELFAARKQDFVLNVARGQGTWALPLSKGGQRRGVQEVIALDDPWLIALLALYLNTLKMSDNLRRTTAKEQRRRLTAACDASGLRFDFQWYSLRRGGATHELQRTQNLAAIMVKGRWGDMNTARIYLQDAQATLSQLQVPDRHMAVLKQRALDVRPELDL
jgi:integrase